MDMIAAYVASKPWVLRPNIVLVEGTTDEAVFEMADRLSTEAGHQLLGDEICIAAAGNRDHGGTFGVARELITLRSMVPLVLDRQGKPAYRVMGLVDYDHAGRRIIQDVLRLDRSAVEFRDILAVRPINPTFVQINPSDRGTECKLANQSHSHLDWEIEDMFSSRLLNLFEQQHPEHAPQKSQQGGKIHHDFTRAAKRALHQLVQMEATLDDLDGVVSVVHMIRSIVGLPVPVSPEM